ncbi:hypothetical protein GQ55_4G345000 [Panicum hallii var. hallii]|jgi:CCR4-NOT transcription complex subunit 7/8|uniref:poly(A)-specific ribonuclease n=2 Tax=Panicum hallii TaxID=206008 RepID=A0A2T7E385_9POAL|nr:probable CCR4-associated factor 1 homolog 11 [Panicum hallii]PAN25911.1 hypothetical protein PAHAL_4G333900 [Panicum hallii]PUZ62289.1 hypothetical protein GQ55_4G345000 [Panicum hallii var. hallii]
MPSRDGGPAVIHPQPPPPPPPPLPSSSFAHFVPQYHPAMVPYAPQPAQLVYSPSSAAAAAKAEVRDVWAGNFEEELSNIAALLPYYPCVCVDTEFPGAVHDSGTPRYLRGPRESYALVKRNVDDLKLLQVGFALSGAAGRCPVAWQFNVRGFDPARDPHAPASIAMLRAQGMDFATLREFGVRPDDFAAGFYRCGLGCGQLTWAAFAGAYDFAYVAKVLTGGRPLPDTLDGFHALVQGLFGPKVLDVKHLARCCGHGGIRGGLEQVAAALGVKRAAGRAHCAGSDSLLTIDVLLAMVDRFFRNSSVLSHAGTIVDLA